MTNRAKNVFKFDTNETLGTVSEAVIDAVASTAGKDPLDIEPLHSAVDPDALDALLVSGRDTEAETDTDLSVTFPYAGFEVTVWSHGRIVVTDR